MPNTTFQNSQGNTFSVPTGSYLINPGSVYQESTNGGAPTYPGAPSGFAQGAASVGTTGQAAAPVVTPTNTPAGASVYQGAQYGYMPASPQTMFGNKTVNGIPVITSDFVLNPNNKYADVSLSNNNAQNLSTSNITNSNISQKADAIVAQNTKKTTAIDNLNNYFLSNPTGLSTKANQNFINAAAQAILGRDASKDEIGKGNKAFNMVGMTTQDVINRFNAVAQQKGGTGYTAPSLTDNSNPPKDGNGNPSTTDPAITDLQTGLIDMQKFQKTWLEQFQGVIDEVAQAQTNLINYQSQTTAGKQNIGQQVGEEQGLLTGEAAAYEQQRALQENTLSQLLGVAQTKQSNLLQAGQMQLSIMNAENNLRQQIYQQTRDLRQDQKDAAAMYINAAEAGALDLTKLTPDQTMQISNSFKAIGLDPQLGINMLKLKQAQGITSGYQQQIITDGSTQYLLVTDKSGKIISKTKVGTVYRGGGGGGNTPTTNKISKTDANAIISALNAAAGKTDGYVSPDDYNNAKQDWIARGGDSASFDDAAKGRVNPNNPYYNTAGNSPSNYNSPDYIYSLLASNIKNNTAGDVNAAAQLLKGNRYDSAIVDSMASAYKKANKIK